MLKRYEDRNIWLSKVNKAHPKGHLCTGCPLVHVGAGFARSAGTGRNGIALIGDSLNETSAEKGKPLEGDGGSMLTRILHRVSLKKDDFLVMNVINCNPPQDKLDGTSYGPAAISHCNPYFLDTITKNPHIQVLVPMGNTATYKLLGVEGVYSFHGTIHWHSGFKKWVVPTLDPGQVMAGMGSTKTPACAEVLTVINDLNTAFEVLKDGYVEPKYDFILEATLASATHFVHEYERALLFDQDVILSCDIETPYSKDIDEEDKDAKDSSWTIERISFTFRAGHAITMPWCEPFIGLSRRLLHSIGDKLFWNGNKFDVPRLRKSECNIRGRIIDGMDAFHFLYSDLPRGLGYAAPFFTRHQPWKHLSGSNMPFYSCMDSLVAWDIYHGVKHRLVRDGLWDVFLRDFVDIEPTFQAMGEVGIGINQSVQADLRNHYVALRDNSNAIIQELVPEEVKPFIKKGGYKGKPKEIREYHKAHPELEIEKIWATFGFQSYTDSEGNITYNKKGDFNPNSTLQIQDYIKWKYGAEALPRNKKDTEKVTTGNEELARLAARKNDKVLFTIVDSSSAGDKLSSFIDNWPIASDGRVHPTFTNNPATFRLSSVRPNSQNFPHRSEEMDKMREMIIAGDSVDDDWYLIECVVPETKILKSDLSWTNADTLAIGDELIGFSEQLSKDQKFEATIVKNTLRLKKSCVKITTSYGEITVAANHPFQARKHKQNKKWVLAKDLTKQHQITFFAKPWEYDESREAGYLSGFFDGEGWAHNCAVGYAQNTGPILDYVQALLVQKDFKFSQSIGSTSTAQCELSDGLREGLRFLGSIRPKRLLPKATGMWQGRRTWGKRTPVAKVLSVESVGIKDVIAIETTSKTYISNGFFSHNCDYSGIEAIEVGWYAKDQDYIRMAKLGVHSFYAASMPQINIPLSTAWSDEELRLGIREVKKLAKTVLASGTETPLYDVAKRVVHGSNYWMLEGLMHSSYPECFPSRKDAKGYQDRYFELFPSIRPWQLATAKLADDQNYLKNDFGYRRWFWDAMKWTVDRRTGDWVKVPSGDAKKAVATLPQGSAAAIIRRAMRSDPFQVLVAEGKALIQIHDSLVCRARKHEIDRVVELLLKAMVFPIKEQDGLTIPVEVKVGKNWRGYHETKNPFGMREVAVV